MGKKILLVEDESDLVEFMKYSLEQEKFTVLVSYDGKDALEKMAEKPDLVVLDVMMPKLDGFEVCKTIRATPGIDQTPIIFLTAKSAETDEIYGLEIGADDYIQKPISPKKLIARVKANLRNFENKKAQLKSDSPTIISIGPLVINREKYIISIDSREKVFPRKEFELLFFLASHPGTVYKRDALLKEVWGDDVYVVDRTVDVHIRKIREKLDIHAELIETIKGVGYRFKQL